MRLSLRQGIGVLWCLVFLLALAACAPGGSTTAATSPDTQASATPPAATATAAAPTPGSAALNGCPSKQQPAAAQGQAVDVVAKQKATEQRQSFTLSTGQTLEVRLSASVRWHAQVQDSAGILTTNEATGWYDATLKSCIWRFTALKPGNVSLGFSGVLICPPREQCLAVAMVQQYTVTVR